MNKQEIQSEMRNMSHKIYTEICRYLISDEYQYPYTISANSHSNSNEIIINCGFGLPELHLYFSYDIRIALRWTQNCFYNHWIYFGDKYVLPKNKDEYVSKTKDFFIEFINHITNVKANNGEYLNNGEMACDILPCPEQFKKYAINMANLLEYKYVWGEPDIIDYFIKLTKSDKFKSARCAK